MGHVGISLGIGLLDGRGCVLWCDQIIFFFFAYISHSVELEFSEDSLAALHTSSIRVKACRFVHRSLEVQDDLFRIGKVETFQAA